MALLDSLKKFYTVMAKCNNCGAIQEVKIPKGISVKQYFEQGIGACHNCGVNNMVVAVNKEFGDSAKITGETKQPEQELKKVKKKKDNIDEIDFWKRAK
jgi:hypothetical protein